jgi:hypothetical protein
MPSAKATVIQTTASNIDNGSQTDEYGKNVAATTPRPAKLTSHAY